MACWSEKFNDTQARWHTTDQEQYALHQPLVRKWRNLIGYTPVTAYTDHPAATYLLTKPTADMTRKESRYARDLAERL